MCITIILGTAHHFDIVPENGSVSLIRCKKEKVPTQMGPLQAASQITIIVLISPVSSHPSYMSNPSNLLKLN